MEGLPARAAEPVKSSVRGLSCQNSTGVIELSTHQGGNSASIYATTGISEIEHILNSKTFTRSETERLISLLHSRTVNDDAVERDGAKPAPPTSTIGSLKKHKHGDERDNFHAAVFSSTVLEEEIASPANRMNTYKGPQHPATMENLPDDLLLNIFIRLLAKQLAQMRSVSKYWNALLSQSSFVKSHLRRSIYNDGEIFLHFIDESVFETLIGEQHPDIKLTTFIKFPPVTPQFEYTNFKVIGSVNGLICCSYSDNEIHIWNPSLSAFLTLLPYSTPSSDFDTIKVFFRFGFDPKTDDYKVVKLTGFTGLLTDVVKWWLQVEVYSMKKGSWKLINEWFPSHVTGIRDDDVACADGHDGHLHWLGYIHGKTDSERIVAFDLSSETFRELPLPNSTHGRLKSLRISGGKLCLLSWVGNNKCEVWVMEEYGVVESWVKPHVFSQVIGDTYPFGFTLNNNFLIRKHYCRLVFYDPIANKVESLDRFCMYQEYGAAKVVEYVDSLVWVAPARHEMVDDAQQN